MSIAKELYFDEFRKVTVIEIGESGVLILVDLYPCDIENMVQTDIIHRISINDVDILIKLLNLEEINYFNRAEVEILCIHSKMKCHYINLRLYTSTQILTQIWSRLYEVLHKIVDSLEMCLKQ